jgi:preprotein translocase subunit SecD
MPGEGERDRVRRAMLAASGVRTSASTQLRAFVAVMAVVAAILIVIAAFGSRTGPQSTTVYAAVRFEARLAEDHAAAGLREVRVTGSDRVIYLHEEILVTNSDIARSAVVPGSGPSRFNIGIQLNEAGAEKMRQATANHLGKPIALLIDGEVVMAPVLRSAIGESALITGDYSRAEAERIVNGIGVR